MSLSPAGGRPRRSRPRLERLGAAMIDFAVLAIPQIVVTTALIGAPLQRYTRYVTRHPHATLPAALAHSPGLETALYHSIIAWEALTALYLIAGYLYAGATLGKLVFRLRITRVDGRPLRAVDAVLRSIPFWLPFLVRPLTLYLLLVVFVFNPVLLLTRRDGRGLEDVLGSSMVVHVDEVGQPLTALVPAA